MKNILLIALLACSFSLSAQKVIKIGVGGGGNLIDDTTPQLGGSLDVNGFLVAGRDIEADGILLDAMDTPSERAALYEALSNTNKYTDADKTKVGYLTVSDDADIDAIKVTVAGAEQWTRKMTDLSSPNNTNYPTTLAVVNAINASNLLPLISETTNQTAELTDANGLLNFTNGSDITFTIPQNATVAFPVGTILSARRNGAGNIIIAYSGSASGDTPRTYQYGETVSLLKTGTDTWIALNAPKPDYETITIALSDTSSDIVAGDDVDSFQIQYDMYVTSVSFVADVAGTTTGFEIDINENGTSILSTKLTTDAGEKASSSASVPAVISDNVLSTNAKISFDLTAVPTGAQRLKVSINGYRL